jgi:Tol biopolymer transport system component
MLHRRLRHWVVLGFVAVGALALPGCVPTVWLPDSSGFIYVKPIKAKNPGDPPTGQLVHFDVKTKTSRVIVDKIDATTGWPALSPDGKRIAVARLKGKFKEAKTLQVVLYDFQGKQLHQSKEFPWAPPRENAVGGTATLLFWSPKDDMVVVTDMSETGIYNVKADGLKVIEKAVPVIHGGTPIRPDGKGFLALTGEKDKARLVFMDWAGTEQKIDADSLTSVIPKDEKSGMDALSSTFIVSLVFPSWWDGNAAWVGFKRDKITYAIDTAKKKIDISDAFAAAVKAKKKLGEEVPIKFDFAGDVSVHLVQFKDDMPDKKMTRTFNRVIVVNHKTGKEQTLEAKVAELGVFLPSPDGNYLALCLTSFGLGDDSLILVINSKGKLVSKLTFERPI